MLISVEQSIKRTMDLFKSYFNDSNMDKEYRTQLITKLSAEYKSLTNGGDIMEYCLDRLDDNAVEKKEYLNRLETRNVTHNLKPEEVKGQSSTGKPRRDKVEMSCKTQFEIAAAAKFIRVSNGAIARNLEFNISLSEFVRVLSRKTCQYTGVKFDPDDPKLIQTVERIDNSKGYVSGNVIVVTHVANQIKNELMEKTYGDFYIGSKAMHNFFKAMIKYGV